MSTSPDSVPLKYRSSSDYLASPPRRLLARLNWHPVRETEIATWHLRRETELMRQERIRRKQLDDQIEALFCSDGSCSSPAQATDDGSTPS